MTRLLPLRRCTAWVVGTNTRPSSAVANGLLRTTRTWWRASQTAASGCSTARDPRHLPARCIWAVVGTTSPEQCGARNAPARLTAELTDRDLFAHCLPGL